MRGLVSSSPCPSLFFSHHPSSSSSSEILKLRNNQKQQLQQQQQQQRIAPFISLSSSTSSSFSSVVEEEKPPASPVESVGDNDNTDSLPFYFSSSGCKSCAREQIERGCNGEGRIQGGIATIPGFGWWPIKAYRPCPGFLESGGNYRRRGQSMDEVAFGGGRGGTSVDDLDNAKKKGKNRRQFKG